MIVVECAISGMDVTRVMNRVAPNRALPKLIHRDNGIETGRWECNEERPRKALGGLTPADYEKP